MNSQKLVYAKPNLLPQPLFARWYTWPYLIAPASCAMNVVGRHLKIMASYLEYPDVHADSVKNPKLLGGPFMDLGGGRLDEVVGMLDWTLTRCAPQIELCEAIKKLNEMLTTEAKGFSLQELYPRVPDALRGYVELTYDLNNQPSFRFYEPLLYNSKYYDESLQSVHLSLVQSDERPFVLSTPRIDSEAGDEVHLEIPYRHEGLDELFRMRTSPKPLGHILEHLPVPKEQQEQFAQFFTEEAPAPFESYNGDGMRLRYFGHACILLETRECNILMDPVISYHGYPQEVDRFTYANLPAHIDYVLITHNHQDHILLETLMQLRHKVGTVVVPRNGGGFLQDPSLKLILQACGFPNVVELGEMEALPIPGGALTGLPFLGEHSDLGIQSKIVYHVQMQNFKALFATDSCNVEPRLYEHIHKAVGDVDVLFMGMECDGAPLSWLYGPLLSSPMQRDMDHSRRLAGSNYEQGIKLVERFGIKELYVYAMGQEPWLNYIMSLKYSPDSNPIVASNRLLEDASSRGIKAERLFGRKEIIYPLN